MKVFGIDPGSTTTGYGIVELNGSSTRHIDNGGIHLSSSEPLPQRLADIYREISALLDAFAPDIVAIESVFMAKNVASTMKLGQARGAAMVAVANAGIPIAEYTPMQVKQAITGYGGATKEQIQKMVRTMLKLPDVAFEDASDALAIAICHCQSAAFKQRVDRAKG
jgi:crossover junction endodeoxyribonuclease RuvC